MNKARLLSSVLIIALVISVMPISYAANVLNDPYSTPISAGSAGGYLPSGNITDVFTGTYSGGMGRGQGSIRWDGSSSTSYSGLNDLVYFKNVRFAYGASKVTFTYGSIAAQDISVFVKTNTAEDTTAVTFKDSASNGASVTQNLKLLSTVSLPSAGGWNNRVTATGDISLGNGTYDVYFRFNGANGQINLSTFQFVGANYEPFNVTNAQIMATKGNTPNITLSWTDSISTGVLGTKIYDGAFNLLRTIPFGTKTAEFRGVINTNNQYYLCAYTATKEASGVAISIYTPSYQNDRSIIKSTPTGETYLSPGAQLVFNSATSSLCSIPFGSTSAPVFGTALTSTWKTDVYTASTMLPPIAILNGAATNGNGVAMPPDELSNKVIEFALPSNSFNKDQRLAIPAGSIKSDATAIRFWAMSTWPGAQLSPFVYTTTTGTTKQFIGDVNVTTAMDLNKTTYTALLKGVLKDSLWHQVTIPLDLIADKTTINAIGFYLGGAMNATDYAKCKFYFGNIEVVYGQVSDQPCVSALSTSASTNGTGNVLLRWNNPTNAHFSKVNIYNANDDIVTAVPLATVNKDITAAAVHGTVGVSCQYKVLSYDDLGNVSTEVLSNIVTPSSDGTLNNVTNLNVTISEYGAAKATLTWNDNLEADGVNIYNANNELLSTVVNGIQTATVNAVYNMSNTFTVKAYKGANEAIGSAVTVFANGPGKFVMNDFNDGSLNLPNEFAGNSWTYGSNPKPQIVTNSGINNVGSDSTDADRGSFMKISSGKGSSGTGLTGKLSSKVKKITYWVKLDNSVAGYNLTGSTNVGRIHFWNTSNLKDVTINDIGYGKWKYIEQTFTTPLDLSSGASVSFYGVEASNTGGENNIYVDDITLYDDTPPTDTTQVFATIPENGKSTISWTAIDKSNKDNYDFSYYNLYKNGNLLKSKITETSILTDAAVNDVFVVKSVDYFKNESVGISRRVVNDLVPPQPVTNAVATASGDGSGKVTISWVNPSDVDLECVGIYYGSTLINIVNKPNTSITITNQRLNSLKSYKLVAMDSAGNSSVPAYTNEVKPTQAVAVPTGRVMLDDANTVKQFWFSLNTGKYIKKGTLDAPYDVAEPTNPSQYWDELSIPAGDSKGVASDTMQFNASVKQSQNGIEGVSFWAKAIGKVSSTLRLELNDRDSSGNSRSWSFILNNQYMLDGNWAQVYIPLSSFSKPTGAVFDPATLYNIKFYDPTNASTIWIDDFSFAYTPNGDVTTKPTEISNVSVLENSFDNTGRVILGWDAIKDGTVKQINIYDGNILLGTRFIGDFNARYIKVYLPNKIDSSTKLTLKTVGYNNVMSDGITINVKPTSSIDYNYLQVSADKLTTTNAQLENSGCLYFNNTGTASITTSEMFGVVNVWAKVKGNATSSDFNIDGGNSNAININSSNWVWVKLATNQELTKSSHTFALTNIAAGTSLDEILITKDLALIPKVDNLSKEQWLEAEANYSELPYIKMNDPLASGGQYIGTNDNDTDTQVRAKITLDFNSSQFNQKIWARVKATNNSNIKISYDDGNKKDVPLNLTENWQWQLIDTITTPQEGNHKLIIYRDTAGVKIDRICISENESYIPTDKGEYSESPENFQFFTQTDDYKALMWIPPQSKKIKGLLFTKTNLSEPNIILSPAVRQACAQEDIAIIYTTILTSSFGVDIGAMNYSKDDQMVDALLYDLMDRFAKISGYDEIRNVPYMSTSHSASVNTGFSLALVNNKRAFARMPMKSGFGHTTTGRTGDNMDYTPLLMISNVSYNSFVDTTQLGGNDGFYWFGTGLTNARERGALFGNVIMTDGHLDYSNEEEYMMQMFIKKTAHNIIPEFRAVTGLPLLNKPNPTDGYLVTCNKKMTEADKPVKMSQYSGNFFTDRKMWYIDEEMATFAYNYFKDYTDLITKNSVPPYQQVKFIDKVNSSFNVNWGPAYVKIDNCDVVGTTEFKLYKGFWTNVEDTTNQSIPLNTVLGHSNTNSIVKSLIGSALEITSNTNANFTFKIKPSRLTYLFSNNLYFMQENYGEDGYVYTQTPLRFEFPIQKSGVAQSITFPKQTNMFVKDKTKTLNAVADSGLGIDYIVLEGPAEIEGNVLKLTSIPNRTKYPIKIRTAALQLGTFQAPLYNTAKSVEQTFYVYNDAVTANNPVLLGSNNIEVGSLNNATKLKFSATNLKTESVISTVYIAKYNTDATKLESVVEKKATIIPGTNDITIDISDINNTWNKVRVFIFDGGSMAPLFNEAIWFNR